VQGEAEGRRGWLGPFVLLAAVVVSLAWHGWAGLPPARAPLGFKAPVTAVAMLGWAAVEVLRALRTFGRPQRASLLLAAGLGGGALLGNHVSAVFWSGPCVSAVASLVILRAYARSAGTESESAGQNNESARQAGA
jgi:hypothetical protein